MIAGSNAVSIRFRSLRTVQKAHEIPEATIADSKACLLQPPGLSCDEPSNRRKFMDNTLDSLLGFAPDYDQPIPYMRRTREYYAAIGYTTPYRWAHYLSAPFTALRKPLSASKVAIVTTAAPYQPDKGDQGPGAPYNGSAKFYQVYSGDTSVDHDLRISHIGYDRTHTTATDSGTWFPLPALRRAAAVGGVGGGGAQVLGGAAHPHAAV